MENICRQYGQEREREELKMGLDANVLIASVKKAGEKFRKDALGIRHKIIERRH